MQDIIVKMTEARLGIALVGTSEKLDGIITDGDLRRALINGSDLDKINAKEIMNTSPLIVSENDNLESAHERMKESRVQCLVVKGDSQKIVGVIQIFK